MSRRPPTFPSDAWPPRMLAELPHAQSIIDDEREWEKWGVGGEWPWQPERWVYFVQADNELVRIGSAKNVDARLASHRSSSPVALTLLGQMPGGLPLERAIHQAFAAQKSHGSWYLPAPEILSVIEWMRDM